MRLIRALAILNILAAGTFAIVMSALSGGRGFDPLQIASISKTVPNSGPFALDIVSQYAALWQHRADMYHYCCYGLLALAIVNAVGLVLLTQRRSVGGMAVNAGEHPAMKSSPKFSGWREWLPMLHGEITLHDPAAEVDVAAAEVKLNVKFDEQLRSLLLATDGVVGPNRNWLVWSAEQIVTENQMYRTTADFKDLYMPFDHLLLIGETGNGDLFAYPITVDGNTRASGNIFRWDHETDGRLWVASSLRQYLEGFTSGTIEA